MAEIRCTFRDSKMFTGYALNLVLGHRYDWYLLNQRAFIYLCKNIMFKHIKPSRTCQIVRSQLCRSENCLPLISLNTCYRIPRPKFTKDSDFSPGA